MLILVVTAFLTSIVSAILGMAGGVMLLAVMLSFLDHAEAIPTHAAVQIASNGTRVAAFRQNVDWSAFGRFVLGVVPGGTIGVILLWTLGPPEESEAYLKTLVGAYILLATWMPRRKKRKNESDDLRGKGVWWDFPAMGLAAGTAALTVGAVGPLIAPLFARREFAKERLIATKAVCQLATHVVKIPAFVLLRDLDLGRLGTLAVFMIMAVIPGTLVGKQLLQGVDERHFRMAFYVALTLAGLKVLVVDGVMKM
ncbi:MAG: sulfite exporter TauE/SafE family protein [Planctomycetota bacterium]